MPDEDPDTPRRNDAKQQDFFDCWAADYEALVREAPGSPVDVVEQRLRAFIAVYPTHSTDMDIAFTARALSNPRWGRQHPLRALALAVRFRHDRSIWRSLRWLWRPRWAG